MEDSQVYQDFNAQISSLERKRQEIRLQRESLESSLQRKQQAQHNARQQFIAKRRNPGAHMHWEHVSTA
jgi:hypothetical protein